jgi:hypothetical protein
VQNLGAGGGQLVISVGGGDGSGASAMAPTCASDLRSVVDGSGAQLEQCSMDEGCAGGDCIPACEAAARSKGSIGCEFLALDPPIYGNGRTGGSFVLPGICFAAILANAWDRPAKISVSRGGQTLDLASFARIPRGTGATITYEPLPETGLPANEVAVLFLSQIPADPTRNTSFVPCPVAAAVQADAAIQGPGRGLAFRITTDTPVSAYDIIPYGGWASRIPGAALLLPTAAWGSNYIAFAPSGVSPPRNAGELWATVVAREDGTTVKVAPPVSLIGGANLLPAPAGEVTEYTLAAGEAIQWIDPTVVWSPDPTGTVFESNKPIGLWTGNTYLTASSATTPPQVVQDSTHLQLAAIQSLGSEYVGPGLVTRLVSGKPESVPYHLMGVVDGTKLSWDSAAALDAPTELNRGQIVKVETTQLFSVRSQDADHPFVFTQYMPGPASNAIGCREAIDTCPLGDADWLSPIPTQQFLPHYVFFTDPSFSTTTLVVTRRRGASGFRDVTLECLGKLSDWQPVGSAGMFEVAHVQLMLAGVPFGNCATSRHVATSDGAFGVIVWGTDADASYGYPAGGNFGPANDVVVPITVR